MKYSFKGQFPISFEQIPDRIRLKDGTTRTNKSTFSAEELIDAGYTEVDDPPEISVLQSLKWENNSWSIIDNSEEATANEWARVRNVRDVKIREVSWRIERYNTQLLILSSYSLTSNIEETRLELNDTEENILKIATYIQQLRDITKQSDPFNITWPEPTF